MRTFVGDIDWYELLGYALRLASTVLVVGTCWWWLR